MTKYLDNNGLLYVWKKLKATFAGKSELQEVATSIPKSVTDLLDADSYAKVDSIPKTVASLTDSNQYAKKTDLPKNVEELSGIELYAKISSIPKNVSDLADYANYVNKSELTDAVKELKNSIQNVEFKVVSTLPGTGEKSTIYLVSNGKADGDAYDEYIWVEGKFEKIGNTSVDLSDYIKSSEIGTISNGEIDALFV